MYKCDIKIMASPKRYAYVLNMCMVLILDIAKDVFFDDRPIGGNAAYTSEKTWNLPFEDGVTHRCVLQDDLLICKKFEDFVNQIVNQKPNAVFSLFCPQSKMVDYMDRYGIPQLVKNKRGGVWGQAVIIPRFIVHDIYTWGNKIAKENNAAVFHDDVLIGEYAVDHGIDVYIPIPNPIQHLAPVSSLLGFNNKNKTSKVFDMDAGKLNWSKCSESSISIPNSVLFYK